MFARCGLCTFGGSLTEVSVRVLHRLSVLTHNHIHTPIYIGLDDAQQLPSRAIVKLLACSVAVVARLSRRASACIDGRRTVV